MVDFGIVDFRGNENCELVSFVNFTWYWLVRELFKFRFFLEEVLVIWRFFETGMNLSCSQFISICIRGSDERCDIFRFCNFAVKEFALFIFFVVLSTCLSFLIVG